jgi:thioredoxin 1
MAGNLVEVGDNNFQNEVLSSKEPVLVDFWASWCGPCLAIAPHVEALAKEYAGKVKVTKLDVDAHPKTAGAYGIRSIPTLILFKDGKAADQVIGAVSKSRLEDMIKRHI